MDVNRSVQFSSVAQSCLTLCNPMNCSTPGLPVHHQLQESTHTHIHWVGDAIQPSHPLSSSSLPALNLSQHQGLFKLVSSSHQMAKALEFQLQHQYFQWTPDGQYQNQIDYILGSQRLRSSIQSAKTRLGADCDSDHELLTAKLKKVGKTTISIRHDLNQIPYDYTVEVTNRFKGLDLIDRVPVEIWKEVHDIVQESGIKTIPKKKKCKKQNGCLRRPYK